MNSSQRVRLESKCIRVMTPNYPQNYPQYSDVQVNISLPEGNCWNVSMRFQSIFNLTTSEGCIDSFVKITLIGNNNETMNIGPFCGHELPHDANMEYIQFPPFQALQIHFKSDGGNPQQGFTLKICKEDCCYENGSPNFWLEWGEWSYPDIFPYQEYINTNVKRRLRECEHQCECQFENIDLETGVLNDPKKGRVEVNLKLIQYRVFH